MIKIYHIHNNIAKLQATLKFKHDFANTNLILNGESSIVRRHKKVTDESSRSCFADKTKTQHTVFDIDRDVASLQGVDPQSVDQVS